MCFHKNAKLIALFAAIIVLFAGLISCEQVIPGSASKVDTAGLAGNIPVERLGLIGKAPARSLNTVTGSPMTSYTFPAFLAGIWAHEFGDIFHLYSGSNLSGYGVFGWPPSEGIGWTGTFEAVYYFDDANPSDSGLFFTTFDETYTWAMIPVNGGGDISAFYYEKVDADTYYLLNLAMAGSDPDYPDYSYGQPMYASVTAALNHLLQPGVLDSMLSVWVEYDKQ